MEPEDYLVIGALILLLVFVIGVIGIIYTELVLYPQAMDKANEMCKLEGYNYVESIDIYPFTTTLINVKCGIVQEIKINMTEPVIVVASD